MLCGNACASSCVFVHAPHWSTQSRSATTCLGVPVVPPLSETRATVGCDPYPLGMRSAARTSRSSSTILGKSARSSMRLTSVRGSKGSDFARFSQYVEPVSGLKCHSMGPGETPGGLPWHQVEDPAGMVMESYETTSFRGRGDRPGDQNVSR